MSHRLALAALAACIAIVGAVTWHVASGQAVGSKRGNPRVHTYMFTKDMQLEEAESPACTRGRVWLGKRPGSIEFRAVCRTRSGGGLSGVFLSRSSRYGDPNHPGIHAFRIHPKVQEIGGEKTTGYCQLKRHILACTAKGKGRIRIDGRIWVKPKWRCAMGVTLFVFEPAECRSGACSATLEVRYLARGRPEGC